jgi:hypothetical protein
MITHLYIYPSEPSACDGKHGRGTVPNFPSCRRIPKFHITTRPLRSLLALYSAFRLFIVLLDKAALYIIFSSPSSPEAWLFKRKLEYLEFAESTAETRPLTIFPPTPACASIAGYLTHFEHTPPDGRHTSRKQLGQRPNVRPKNSFPDDHAPCGNDCGCCSWNGSTIQAIRSRQLRATYKKRLPVGRTLTVLGLLDWFFANTMEEHIQL